HHHDMLYSFYQTNHQPTQKIILSLHDALPIYVVPGGKENNKVLRQFGKKPTFTFQPKDHVQLATDLGLIDYERGAKMSGSRGLRSEEHTSELQSHLNLVCRLLLEKKKISTKIR